MKEIKVIIKPFRLEEAEGRHRVENGGDPLCGA